MTRNGFIFLLLLTVAAIGVGAQIGERYADPGLARTLVVAIFTARVVCPPGAQLIYEETTDSEGDTSLSGYCQAPGEQPREKTLEFLLAIYGMYTMAVFAALFSAGTIIRIIRLLEKSRLQCPSHWIPHIPRQPFLRWPGTN